MGLGVTIAILLVALIATVLANILSRRPLELGKVRLTPHLAIQFVGILLVLLMAAHLITLLTGKPFAGRFG